jgi:hypothetical protein
MGHFSLTIVTSLTLLLAYSVLSNGANAASVSDSGENSLSPGEMALKRKAPGNLLRKLPILRFRPSGNSFSLNPSGYSLNPVSPYRSYLVPQEAEFMDETAGNMEKRFDDYGHMR